MKPAFIVIIHDVDKPGHIEALTPLFANKQSVKLYGKHRLNPLVTVIIKTIRTQVPDEYPLVDWTTP